MKKIAQNGLHKAQRSTQNRNTQQVRFFTLKLILRVRREYFQSNFRTTQTLMLCLVACDVQSVTCDYSFSGNHKLINSYFWIETSSIGKIWPTSALLPFPFLCFPFVSPTPSSVLAMRSLRLEFPGKLGKSIGDALGSLYLNAFFSVFPQPESAGSLFFPRIGV